MEGKGEKDLRFGQVLASTTKNRKSYAATLTYLGKRAKGNPKVALLPQFLKKKAEGERPHRRESSFSKRKREKCAQHKMTSFRGGKRKNRRKGAQKWKLALSPQQRGEGPKKEKKSAPCPHGGSLQKQHCIFEFQRHKKSNLFYPSRGM